MSSGFVEWIQSDAGDYASFGMVVACVSITFYNIVKHLTHYTRDDLQRHIVRILLVVPVYTVAGWLEMLFPDTRIVAHSLVNFWEALVIYSFFNLILEYVGGEHNWLVCVQHTHPEGLNHTWPFNYCFKPMDLDPKWMRYCKLACFQFVLIKPIYGLLMLPLVISGDSEHAPWSVISTIVYNVTYTVALYALALLYMTTHDHPSLKPKRPLAKFATIKMVVFFTYWQQYLLMFFNFTPTELADILCFLTIVEMTLVTIPLNWIAFPWTEFDTTTIDISSMVNESKVADDADSDIELGKLPTEVEEKRKLGRFHAVMENAKKIFSPDDMVENAKQNIRSKYQTHVLLESAQEYVIEENPLSNPIGVSSPEAASQPSTTAGANRKKKRFFRRQKKQSNDSSAGDDSSGHESNTQAAGISASALNESPPLSPRAAGSSPRKIRMKSASTSNTNNVPIPLLPMPPVRNPMVKSTDSFDDPQFTILSEESEEYNDNHEDEEDHDI